MKKIQFFLAPLAILIVFHAMELIFFPADYAPEVKFIKKKLKQVSALISLNK